MAQFMGVTVLLEKSEVFCYRIPRRIQRKQSYVHRAKDWDTSNPLGTYRFTLNAARGYAFIELLDQRKSNFVGYRLEETPAGQSLPIYNFPGPVLQPVMDSSRYFTLRLRSQNESSNDDNDYETIGIGFSKRSDIADINQTLTSFFASQATTQAPLLQSQSQLNLGAFTNMRTPLVDLGEAMEIDIIQIE